MKQDLCLCLTLLLLVCISVSRSGRFQVVGPVDRVVAVAGEDVVLPCYLKPNISAEALVVRWFKQDVVRPVHLYANKRNNEDKQDASYVGRTQLFREELKAGNTSLKLFRVRVSDNGRYNCFVHDEPKNEYDDISIQLLVKAIGKQPVISIEGQREGGVGLLCESAGWYPQPELIWKDGEGHNLTAGPTETDRDSMDLFIVKQRLIAHKGTSKLTCRVLLQQFRQERDTEVHIPGESQPF
ncbi:hypothetical protein AAFF_G00331200 [Aldrovandia affinis]|uniref:Ig-like domain-containing protein n=1 Tax=Aldrovandia affinis TaxID=143900 RepID=A0AAD7R6P5_9TELE|nr:hypothetical protein AAFF_G00331200 [Aldrovandia affinis]